MVECLVYGWAEQQMHSKASFLCGPCAQHCTLKDAPSILQVTPLSNAPPLSIHPARLKSWSPFCLTANSEERMKDVCYGHAWLWHQLLLRGRVALCGQSEVSSWWHKPMWTCLIKWVPFFYVVIQWPGLSFHLVGILSFSIYVQTATAQGVSYLLEGAPSLPLVQLPYSWLNPIITQSKKCSLVLFLKKMRHWILMGFSTQHSEVRTDGAACSTVWENQKISRVRTLCVGFAVQDFIYIFLGHWKYFTVAQYSTSFTRKRNTGNGRDTYFTHKVVLES